MRLPFEPVGIERSIKEAQAYREAKELLKEFSKHLPVPVRFGKWVEIDKEMAEEPLENLPAIFERVIQYQLPWALGLLPRPIIKTHQVLTQAIQQTLLWKALSGTLQNVEQLPALVLFNLNRCGIWCAHTTGQPSKGVYVCVPAQQNGKSNITIEPLSQWAERNCNA